MNDQNDFFDDVIDDEQELNDSSLVEFDEEGDEDDDEEEPVEVRTAVMTKNGMLALLSLKTFSSGGQVIRTDPREALPTAQSYDDGDDALLWFRRSLATSLKNGWGVVYDGEPLFG
jgi:hypothetical protein